MRGRPDVNATAPDETFMLEGEAVSGRLINGKHD